MNSGKRPNKNYFKSERIVALYCRVSLQKDIRVLHNTQRIRGTGLFMFLRDSASAWKG